MSRASRLRRWALAALCALALAGSTGTGHAETTAQAGLGAAAESAALDAALARVGDDPAALRALASELVRVDRIDEATRLIERALAVERGATTRSTPEPEPKGGQIQSLTLAATLAGGVFAVIALGLLLYRSSRSRGDLSVAIEYPLDRRGRFNVRLLKQRPALPAAPVPEADEAAALRARFDRASSRFEHTMVGRETQFRGIPARNYFVTLEGLIEDGAGHAPTFFEEREVHVAVGQSVRLEFDLRPRACPVEIHVLRRGQPAANVRLALAGVPDSLRDAEQGGLCLPLPRGRHRIVAGSDDRVAERTLEIESLDPQVLTIDLDDTEKLVFRSCDAAVEPYLRGEYLIASNALERAGQRPVAHLLRAELHRARGEFEAAALQYEAAGRLLEAAEVHAHAGARERAAVLFERAGDPVRAAAMHRAAGDRVRAGRCYEAAGDLQNAAACYREANAVPKLIDVLEKLGDHFEAGRLAFEREETTRAVRNLQQVDPRHPGYTQACRILAESLLEQERVELSVQKADEAITFASDDQATPELFAWYGNLLDRAGRTERALRVFQDLAERNPDEAALRSRIEELEAKLSREQMQGGAAPSGALGGESSRYEVLEEIGRGGMGIVYRARDRRLGRIVALKRLPDNLKDHPRAVDLFLREARSAAALNHPNIVTLHDVDQEGGVYFLTMELLKGAPFHMILKKRGRLGALDVARVGVQIANGLHYAHARGIVHRDVKTANLFFTNEKIVKIMDFGLAKLLEEVRRASTQVTGTPYYMAPEQATGVGVDHRVDLYSFGVTLFELLTGSLPFTDGDILFQHKEAPPPDPRESTPSVPEDLARLVLRLMAKRADERGADAAQVAAELQAIADRLLAK